MYKGQDGDTAEDDSCPGGVKGQLRQQVEDADKQGDAGEDQAGHGLLHAAPLQKSLQSMDQMAHILSLYLWGYMYIIPIGVCLDVYKRQPSITMLLTLGLPTSSAIWEQGM